MDIKTIKEVVNSSLPLEIQEKMILDVIASDEKVMPYIIQILQNERKQNKNLILDSNLELSRALVTLNMSKPTDTKTKKAFKEQTDFVILEIKKHYLKWQSQVKCCFNVEGLP